MSIVMYRIKDDDTFREQVSVDQTGVMVSREFDDLDVKFLGDVVYLEVLKVFICKLFII